MEKIGAKNNEISFKRGSKSLAPFLNFIEDMRTKHNTKWVSDSFLDGIGKKKNLVSFGVHENKQLAGYGIGTEYPDKNGVFLFYILVDPDFQRKGHGTKMINFIKTRYKSISAISRPWNGDFYSKNQLKRIMDDSHEVFWKA